jgi:hypothetical protein
VWGQGTRGVCDVIGCTQQRAYGLGVQVAGLDGFTLTRSASPAVAAPPLSTSDTHTVCSTPHTQSVRAERAELASSQQEGDVSGIRALGQRADDQRLHSCGCGCMCVRQRDTETEIPLRVCTEREWPHALQWRTERGEEQPAGGTPHCAQQHLRAHEWVRRLGAEILRLYRHRRWRSLIVRESEREEERERYNAMRVRGTFKHT